MLLMQIEPCDEKAANNDGNRHVGFAAVLLSVSRCYYWENAQVVDHGHHPTMV